VADPATSPPPTCVSRVTTLPPDTIEVEVKRVKDGDTYVIEKNFCAERNYKLAGSFIHSSNLDEFGEKKWSIWNALKKEGYIYDGKFVTTKFPYDNESAFNLSANLTPEEKHRLFEILQKKMECVVRSRGLNTTELSHFGRAEEDGAKTATKFLKDLILGKKVRISKPAGQDGYQRVLADEIFIPTPENDGTYVLANVSMIQRGFAHLFIFEASQEPIRVSLLPCEKEAHQNRRGIWDTPAFQGAFHVTSFHHAKLPYYSYFSEYFRFANISGATLNLRDYVVENCATGKRIPLPDVEVPAGVQVQALSKTDRVNLTYTGKPIIISLDAGEDFWSDAGAMVVLRREADGNIEATESSSAAFQCTPGPWTIAQTPDKK